MSTLFKLAGEFLPWAVSFSFVKWLIAAIVAAVMCFGGYVFLSGETAKTQVQILRRENSTLSRQKVAVERRIKSDAKVSPLVQDDKIKELSRWATIPTKKE